MLRDRGVSVDHTTVYRWIQAHAVELEKRLRPHLRPADGSWRVEETYIKVKGRYLDRAVDSQTIDFRLSARRDAAAAKRAIRFAADVRKALAWPNTRLADITVESEVTSLTGSLNDRQGRIDILVNNAAVRRQTPLTDMTLAEWREITGIVLDGAFLLSRAVLPGMLGRGDGRIVSIGGLRG